MPPAACRAQAPWAARGADRLDARTLEDWLRARRHGRRARTLLAIAGRTIWGAEPRELSLLYTLQYVSGAGGLDALLDTDGGAQHERFDGGAHEIAARMAAALGSRIRLGAAVDRIAADGDGVAVHANGVTARAAAVVVALPPPLCAAITFDPEPPPARRAVHERMRMGALTKCFAIYDEPFWRADGLTGEALSDRSPAGLTFDVSPPGGSCGVLVGFVGGDAARAHAARGEADGRAAVLEGLARVFGSRALTPDGWAERAMGRRALERGRPGRDRAAGGAHRGRPGAARAVRPRPVGGDGDRGALGRVHRGRRRRRRACRGAGARAHLLSTRIGGGAGDRRAGRAPAATVAA